MLEVPSSLTDLLEKMREIDSRFPPITSTTPRDMEAFDALHGVIKELGKEAEGLKGGMSEAQISDARMFCSSVRREIARLEREVERLEKLLRRSRSLCHHDGDQGCGCVYCGQPSFDDF